MVKRNGFGLVEVIVAMTLLAVGVVSVAASAAFASRMLRISEDREAASRIASALIDSLTAVHDAAGGERDMGRFHVSWGASSMPGSLRVTITSRELPLVPVVLVESVAMPPLPLVPCAGPLCE
ncbi:MAG: prepilin-type N-terminal cleavage/methylation domain-containing protein [Longimicrobiales bacterium]